MYKFVYLRLYYYHLVHTSAGGLLVPEDFQVLRH